MAEEKNIENGIKKWLKDNHFYHFKVHGSIYMENGIPDIISCINGMFVGIEVKASKGIQSLAQKVHEQNIKESKGLYILAKSLEDVLEVLYEKELIQRD